MMNRSNVNLMNSLVVTGLLAASMLMPLVAAHLAQSAAIGPATAVFTHQG